MSYFIGFLIFIATLATDPAFAVDNPTLIHDAQGIFRTLLIIIISCIVLGMLSSLFITIPADTNQLPPRHATSDMLGIISGTAFGTILGWAISGWAILGAILGFILGFILGLILRGTGAGINMTWGIVLGAVFGLLAAMVTAFVSIAGDTTWLAVFCDWLGTKEKEDTLTFIGGIIGGILAVINAIMIYIRSKSQDNNNDLIEKGHVEDRFRFATKALESKNPVMLISAFYQFYYLAKHIHIHDFKKNIFDVLCCYLRDINSETNDKIKTHDEKDMPTEHYQKLLNVLFMPDDNLSIDERIRLWVLKKLPRFLLKSNSLFPFAQFNANLKNVNFTNSVLPNAYFANGNLEEANFTNANLAGANLAGADLSNANFQNAQLEKVNLKEVSSVEYTDFRNAKIGNRDITEEDLPLQYEKGEYCANWHSLPTIIDMPENS